MENPSVVTKKTTTVHFELPSGVLEQAGGQTNTRKAWIVVNDGNAISVAETLEKVATAIRLVVDAGS